MTKYTKKKWEKPDKLGKGQSKKAWCKITVTKNFPAVDYYTKRIKSCLRKHRKKPDKRS